MPWPAGNNRHLTVGKLRTNAQPRVVASCASCKCAFGEACWRNLRSPTNRPQGMAMSLAASIKKLIPTTIKQPLRNYVDEQNLLRQDKLAFVLHLTFPGSGGRGGW